MNRNLFKFIFNRALFSTKASKETISVSFTKADGSSTTVDGQVGKTLLDVVLDNDLDLDGFGACEGTLACSTCHLIFNQSDFDKLGKPSDEELDMLDLAFNLTPTSRLGCQICLKKELDPLNVDVPATVNDAR